MGRRRRTKVRTRPRPKLPTIFDCPICSKKAVSITFNKDPNAFDMRCTNCGKKYHYNNPTRIPVKFGCPNCKEKSVTIEFIESTNSIRIDCSSCDESTSVSAREWVRDPEKCSILPFTPKGAKLGCPKCEFRTISVNVTLQRDYALVQCGACGFQDTFTVTPLDEKVDVYGQLIDKVREQRLHPTEQILPKIPQRQEELSSPKVAPEPEDSADDSENIFD